MNERIEQFATECYQAPEFDYKKFAELIVLECAELVETQHTWITSVAASALIRKHFGVEE